MHLITYLRRTPRSLMLLLAFAWLQQAEAQSISYSSFDSWPLVKLKGGKLVCTDWQTDNEAFIENFDDEALFDSRWDRQVGSDPIQGAFHGAACDNIFVPANVNLVPITPGSSDKILELTTRKETQPVTIPGYNNGAPGQGWGCLPSGVQTLSSEFTAGGIHMKEPYKYNLGRYEIVCQLPRKSNVWSTFWMWHHDEIDIMDLGYYGKFSQNVFHGDYAASLQDSPCCPHFSGCDFCDDIVDHIDCSGYPNCGICNTANPQEVPYNCGYMANGSWHTVGCEWTPYKVMFYVDGVITGTVYRYYNEDKTPVIIECGDEIPEGVVRENPAFLDIKERYFQPIAWIVAEGDDDCPGPGNCNAPEDLPATLKIKEISIRERAYQSVALTGCFDICDEGDVCLDFEFENLNGLYGTHAGVVHVEPIPDPNLNNCAVVSITNGYGTVTKCGPDEVCLTYNADDCVKLHGCVGVRADLGYPPPLNGTTYTKWLTPRKPNLYTQCEGTTVTYRDVPGGGTCFCVDPGTSCSVFVSGDRELSTISYENGLTCFSTESPCQPVALVYEYCGEVKIQEYDISIDFPYQAMQTPHLITAGGSTPLNIGTTYINSSSLTMCYMYPEVQIISAQVIKDGIPYGYSNLGQCLSLSGINSMALVTLTISINGCSEITQVYAFVNRRSPYLLTPNPTSGMARLTIDRTPVPIGDGDTGANSPQPERLMVLDAAGNLLNDIDISNGDSQFPIDLSRFPAGNYQVAVKDGKLAEPIHFTIQKY